MLCFMNKKKSFFLSLLFLFLLLLSSVFLNSGNSFATTVSQSYSLPSSSSQSIRFSDIGSLPDTSSLNSSLPWTYTLSGSLLKTKSSAYFYFSPGESGVNISCFLMSVLKNNDPGSFSCSISESSFWSFRSYHSFGQPYFGSNFAFVWSEYFSDFVFTISDEQLSVPSGNLDISQNGTYDVTSYATATVNVENEVIYGDYHNDLITINNSILTCGAICLVIYFFYCIYRIIIKNSGVK